METKLEITVISQMPKKLKKEKLEVAAIVHLKSKAGCWVSTFTVPSCSASYTQKLCSIKIIVWNYFPISSNEIVNWNITINHNEQREKKKHKEWNKIVLLPVAPKNSFSQLQKRQINLSEWVSQSVSVWVSRQISDCWPRNQQNLFCSHNGEVGVKINSRLHQ